MTIRNRRVSYVVTDEMVNQIISECKKLPPKEYKARYAWVGNVTHWELCKRLKFDLWYMHKSESLRENETHEILWDIERQTNHPIPAGILDQILITKGKKELIK